MDAIIKDFPDNRSDRPEHDPAGRPTHEEAMTAVEVLLRWIGEDTGREGLRDTPARVARAWRELFSGYGQSVEDLLARTFEEIAGYDDLVLLKDIPFHSHCEHHMAPIIGIAHIGYLPAGRAVGLSKLARIVDIFARRLQTQEALTAQIAEAIMTNLKPRGVAVVVEAQHLCMVMRGVQKTGTTTTTTTFNGLFKTDSRERERFMSMLRKPG